MAYAGYPVSQLPVPQAALLAIAGIGCMLVAAFNRNFYWWKAWMSGDRLAPLWVGRLMFGGIGLLFFAIGMYDLIVR